MNLTVYLILQKLYPQISIENVSISDDTVLLQKALSTKEKIIDIGHAGTAIRFLTSYFATQEGREIILTGSERMQERPIKILVDALRELGADISYEKNEGYPPLKIKGKKIEGGEITIDGSVSSQYISSLLLVAGQFSKGLRIDFKEKVTSLPYIEMTRSLLTKLGIKNEYDRSKNSITVCATDRIPIQNVTVESDWSSASYHYSLVALGEAGSKITLSNYVSNGYQGDILLADIYEKYFGVDTEFNNGSITLIKISNTALKIPIDIYLNNSPDIAQTIAVTAFGLGLSCHLTGLHTLKIKETDRLVALKNELEKFGAVVAITDDRLHLKPLDPSQIKSGVIVATYHDHRMAMAFTPLCLKTDLSIEDPAVVSKSYPDFWEHLEKITEK